MARRTSLASLHAVAAALLPLSALALALPGCSSDRGPPGASSTAAAGQVVELAGEVSASRGGVRRALATGADIFADDTIETAAGATVTIRLFHNDARWTLSGGKQRKVADSVAWKAPQGSGVADGEGSASETVAAGRHAENEAADTSATAAAAPPSAAAPPAAAAPPGRDRSAAGRKPMEAAAPPTPPAPQEDGIAAKQLTRGAADQEVMRAGASEPEAAGVAAPGGSGSGAVGTLSEKSGGGRISAGAVGTDERGGTGGSSAREGRSRDPLSKVTVGALDAQGGLSGDAIRKEVVRRSHALQNCHIQALKRDPTVAGRATVILSIGADGTVTAVKVSDAAASLRDTVVPCAVGALQRIHFPASEETTEAEAILVFAGP